MMLLRMSLLTGLLLLGACASEVPRHEAAAPALDTELRASFAQWQHWSLPGKLATRYEVATESDREVLAATADASASMLRQTLRIEPQDLGRVQFSWKVPELIAQADLGRRDTADSPVRLVLAFEGDRARFSLKDSMLSELARTLTGEPMPYATLMYVWCNTRAPGSVIVNPRTERIRKLVVESGPDHLNRWLDYERDIRADFVRAFGEEPGALIGVAIMTDSDNTHTTARAWYGPVRLDRPMLAQSN